LIGIINLPSMKKIFAAFCAIVLMPSFSAQAWIGGPFSNNSFSDVGGDDGIYEASASTVNGIGLYRFAVGNEFEGINPQGVAASVPSIVVFQPGTIVPAPGISSGNVVIGAWGNGFTNIWFYRGVQYFGITFGTVNSANEIAIGMATSRDNNGQGANSITTAFRAKLIRNSNLIAATPFQGVGRAQTSAGVRFRFTVLGSKVSNNLTFGL